MLTLDKANERIAASVSVDSAPVPVDLPTIALALSLRAESLSTAPDRPEAV